MTALFPKVGKIQPRQGNSLSVPGWMDGWMDKHSTRRMEYYSVLKSKEILTYARARMNLEDMLSEISLSGKDNSCVIPLVGGP